MTTSFRRAVTVHWCHLVPHIMRNCEATKDQLSCARGIKLMVRLAGGGVLPQHVSVDVVTAFAVVTIDNDVACLLVQLGQKSREFIR